MNKYRLKISGRNPNSFLKHLISKKIKLYNITDKDKAIFITVTLEDYQKIKKMKTSYKMEVVNRFGLLKLKYLLRKYQYLLIFFCLALFLIIVLSHTIFYVEVVHPKKEIRDLIKKDLKELGISKFKFKKTYQEKESIRNKILTKEKDKIEWLEIDSVGTKYIVNVEERLINDKPEDEYPRDVIAKKDAMILSIEAEEGEVIKKKYDYIRKGETIISGTIKNKEKEVSKVKAQGRVYGEVWYTITVELPRKYHEENRTGKKSKALTINFLNHQYSFPFNEKNKTYQSDKIILLESKLLPLNLSLENKYEVKIIDKKYNLENSLNDALSLATNRLTLKLPSNSSILDKKVLKKSLKDSKINIEVFFKVKEDITDYVRISEELKEETEGE